MSTPRFQMLGPALASSAPDRSPPYSAEAEEHVLACCLLDGQDSIARCLQAGLHDESFFLNANQVLFREIVEIYRSSPPVTLDVLAEQLKTKRLLEAVGGIAYLMQVTSKIPTTAHVGYFIEKVREKAALRWMIGEGLAMVEEAYAFTGGLEQLLRKHLSEQSRGLAHVLRHEQKPKSLAQACDDVLAEFAARRAGTADRTGWIYTGMPSFDDRLLPFGCQRNDHLIVLGGGSGDGKSTLAIQIAGVALARGQRVRAYTKETGAEGFLETLAAQQARVDLKHPEQAPKDRFERFAAEFARMKAEWADQRLWCVEQTGATPLRTIEDLEQDARMFAKLQGGAHLWIVDYAQIFGTEKRCSSREEINAHVAETLQRLSRELGGVWLVLCQLNEKGLAEMRQPKRDADGKVIHRMPNRGDLRESQAYYHAADRVLFIYRPPVDCRDQDQTSPAVLKPEQWIVQDKRRKGGRGYVRCWFTMIFATFEPFPADFSTPPASASSGMTKQQFKGERSK